MNRKPIKKKDIINLFNKLNIINLKSEYINLFDSYNRFISKPVISSINLPPFNNSAVDGYALRKEDVGKKKLLKISDRISAGDDRVIKITKGTVVQIFTGAKMPLNSITVVMQENVKQQDGYIEIIKQPLFGDNCRHAGEDVQKNKKILETGNKITAINISLLAAIGKSSLEVKRKLRVGFFTSGNELLDPSEKLIGSTINNSNQYALHSLLNKEYLDAEYLGVLKDSKKYILKTLLKKLNNYSVIITTGGASVGEEDYLVDIIKEKGKIFFWKTAIKPGRPLAVGKIDNTIIICLPGNPVSVYLLYGMLIKPFLEKLCGSKMIIPNYYKAKVNFAMKKKTARLEWIRVNINKKYTNNLVVNKYPKQGSGIITSIAFSDGIIEVPEEVKQIKKGDYYKFYFFKDLFN